MEEMTYVKAMNADRSNCEVEIEQVDSNSN